MRCRDCGSKEVDDCDDYFYCNDCGNNMKNYNKNASRSYSQFLYREKLKDIEVDIDVTIHNER